MTDRRDRRGQILLVGAVALAATILGLALVTNTVLYTENVGSGDATLDSEAVSEFEFESQRTIQSLLFRLNHLDRNRTATTLHAAAARNVTDYSDALAQLQAGAGTTYVNTSYEDEIVGTRIVQGVDRTFTYNKSHSTPSLGSNTTNWLPVADGTQIGWFLVNADLRNTSGQTANITVESSLGNSYTYALNRSNDGSGGNLSVRVLDDGGVEVSSDSCGAVSARVVVDLRRGRGLSGDCQFTGFKELRSPYTVEITGGDNITGQYSIVVNETWDSSESNTVDPEPAGFGGTPMAYPHCSDGSRQPPCLTPAVWEATVELTYQSGSIDLRTNRTIPVYQRGPGTKAFGSGTLFTAGSSGLKIIEGDSGSVTTVPSTTSDTIEAVGPAETDIDGDGDEDIPYVTGSGPSAEIKILDTNGDVTSLTDSTAVTSDTIQHDKTRLASGTWDGSDVSVFFVDDDNERIVRTTADGTVTEVAAPGNGAQAVVGIGDVDDDGSDELVFADASQQLRYLEADGTTSNLPNGQLGSSSGIGAGILADLNGDGTPAVIGADGSNEIKINREASGGGTTIITEVTAGSRDGAAKSSVTAADVDDDGGLEIAYVVNPPSTGDPATVKYVDSPLDPATRSVVTLNDASGDTVDGSSGSGVV